MKTTYDAPGRRDTPHPGRQSAFAVAELFASLVTVCAIAAVFVSYVGAHLAFFGEPVVIDADEVRFYWTCVSVLVLGVVASFATAALRGGGKSLVWHTVMALTGLFVAVAFSVTETGTPTVPQPEPSEPRPNGSVCHSGGDNTECMVADR